MPRQYRPRTAHRHPARQTRAATAVMEAMEGRTLLSTYYVTNTNNSGAGSLRQAIVDANKHSGADVIAFKIGSGAKTISPTSALPSVTGPTVIDATTQPGFAGKPLIELSGAKAGGAEGLKLTGGSSTVKGLIINRFANSGIMIYGKGGNKITGNFIGTDRAGSLAAGNKAHGVFVQAPDNVIGGTTSKDRNIISGNGKAGVYFYSSSAKNNKVQGNYVGTDVTGNKAVKNLNGVQMSGAPYNTVGGTVSGARNVLSGNTHDGVLINSTGAKYNNVQGNYIGTNAAGTARLGNGWYGVEISQSYNVVGGTTAAHRNVISANGYAGVVMYLSSGTNNRVEGNYIGTDYTGRKDLGNKGAGVDITNGAKHNTVGGTTSAHRNIISGNDLSGVGIYNSSSYNKVLGNYIGLCCQGYALPNTKNGVVINNGSSNNTVKSNRIAYTTYKAVQISSGSTSQAGSNTLYAKVTTGLRLV